MKKIILLVVIAIGLFLPHQYSFAEVTGEVPGKIKPSESSTTTLPNPIGVDDPRIIVGNIIRLILGLVGSLALIFFIYGGLMWMTSAGNSDQVTKGRDTLVWATLGLIVIFASYTGVAFILQSLGGV